MNRLNLGLLVALLALIAFDYATAGERVTREDSGALFGAELAARTVALSIAGAVGELPVEVVIERDGAGGWILPGESGLPALGAVVQMQLENLERVRGLDRLGDDAEADRFGFGGPAERRVELSDAGGVAIAAFRQVPARETGGSYLWVEGRGVYGATAIGTYSLDSTYYLDTALFRFEPGRATALEVQRDGEQVLALVRGDAGAWVDNSGPAALGEAQPTTRVEALLTNLARLPQRGLAEIGGAGAPDWTFRVTLDDGAAEGLEVTQVGSAGWTARRTEWTEDWRVELPPAAFRDVLVRLEGFGVRR